MQAQQRSWEPPKRPWLMAMGWRDLLFAHWPVPADSLRPHMPPGLELQTFDGSAWLGVVPFRMVGVRQRRAPAMPIVSAFPELNVRTYVTAGGKPGVWFFSLDAANPFAVRGARRYFHLPYFDARMRCETGAGEIVRYASRRTHRGAVPGTLVARYRPTGPIARARPGSLDEWLTARYCLYAYDGRRVWRGEIDHVPWPLQPAQLDVEKLEMTALIDVTLPDVEPVLQFVRSLDVVAWSLEPADVP